MIDREHDLSLLRQARLVWISRGTIYYEARPLPERDLQQMRRIDELHLELPLAGSRMLRDLRPSGRSPARRDADEAPGNRGDLSAQEHQPSESRAPRNTRICCDA